MSWHRCTALNLSDRGWRCGTSCLFPQPLHRRVSFQTSRLFGMRRIHVRTVHLCSAFQASPSLWRAENMLRSSCWGRQRRWVEQPRLIISVQLIEILLYSCPWSRLVVLDWGKFASCSAWHEKNWRNNEKHMSQTCSAILCKMDSYGFLDSWMPLYYVHIAMMSRRTADFNRFMESTAVAAAIQVYKNVRRTSKPNIYVCICLQCKNQTKQNDTN